MNARGGRLSVAAVLVAVALVQGFGRSSTYESNPTAVMGMQRPSLGAVSALFSGPSPAAAPRLELTKQPLTIHFLDAFALEVAVLDASGKVDPTYSGPVTVQIAHDGSPYGNARLSGTTIVSAVNGIATFSDLRIDQTGVGYTLHVAALGLPGVTSATFISVM